MITLKRANINLQYEGKNWGSIPTLKCTTLPPINLPQDNKTLFILITSIYRYVNACKLLDEVELKDDKEEDDQKRLLKKLWLNRSYCYLKINHPKQACVVLQQAIAEFPREAKALYRMGKAKKMLANYDESRRYILFINI